MTDLMLSPIGLFLAAVLTVSNVLTDVSRKKVVDRHELVASTFWIRVFAALVFAGALLIRTLGGSPPVIHLPAAITTEDIQDQAGIAARLKQASDPVSRFVSGRLSETARSALAAYPGTGPVPKETLDGLLKDLNGDKVLRGELIYDEGRFAGVSLSAETRDLMAKNPTSEALAYLNRLLLTDAYPQAMARTRTCALFGRAGWEISPWAAFLVYLVIDVVLISLAQILLMAALKASPMSVCIPFMSLSPVFLVATAYLMLGEIPKRAKLLGVGLIVIGSLVMHRKLFASGWTAPLKAIIKEKGPRYVLLVAFILAVTSPIEKQLMLMSDQVTTGFAYGIGLCVFFGVLAWVRRADLGIVMRKTAKWVIVAGVLDAATIFLLYFTFTYLAVVITISIKRAGIILSILAGWLFFKERDLRDRLIAALVMVGGILIFYLPLTFGQSLALACAVLACMVVALAVTHKAAAAEVAAANAKKV